MRYILDENNYIKAVSFGSQVICDGVSCTEYTGSIPSGYSSLGEWVSNAVIQAYYISAGELVYDAAKEAEIEATAAEDAAYNETATRGFVRDNFVSVNAQSLTDTQKAQIRENIGAGDVTKSGFSMRASSTVGKFYYNTGAGEKSIQVKMPTIPVTSVNGQTGDVVIDIPDTSSFLKTTGGVMSGNIDWNNTSAWLTPYLLAFKNADGNQSPTYPYTGFYQWGNEWQVNARDANNNWAKNLMSINLDTAVATFGARPTVNGEGLALLSDIPNSSGEENYKTLLEIDLTQITPTITQNTSNSYIYDHKYDIKSYITSEVYNKFTVQDYTKIRLSIDGKTLITVPALLYTMTKQGINFVGNGFVYVSSVYMFNMMGNMSATLTYQCGSNTASGIKTLKIEYIE